MSDTDTYSIIGKPRRRVDGADKVTGRTCFADDIILPRMLHCKLLRSHVPHAASSQWTSAGRNATSG